MDENNPAVGNQVRVNPVFLEEVGKDPKAIAGWSRKMLLIQMQQMHARMRDDVAPLGAKQAFIEFLAKVGDTLPKQNTAQGGVSGPGFSVNIVLNAPTPATTNPALPAKPVEFVEVIDNAADRSATTDE